MAMFGPSLIAPFATDADLSGSKYRLAALAGNGKVVEASGVTVMIVGVLTDGVADGSSATAGVSVATTGIAKCEAGAAISQGDALTSDGSGRAIATTTGGDNIVGRALTGASGSGEIIEVLLMQAII